MKCVFCFLTSVAFSLFLSAQTPFTGNWQGKLNVGIELRIVFYFTGNTIDSLSATLDSPDQSAFGIKCGSVVINGSEISVDIAAIGGSFKGTLVNDTTIDGTFTQGNSLPLIIHKIKGNQEIEIPKRPQTPQPPFDYNSEEVEYDNAAKTVHLAGTLTYPKTKGPFVTAILISGSGQQDRDETIMNHKLFAVIADHLTKNGYAVLRVDDRGMGKSTGEVSNASSTDFAEDVMTSMDYLKTRKEIDKKKIGLIGHSEGGLIASIVLTQRKDVAFVITLAGTGVKGADILASQGEAILIKQGVDAETARTYNQFYKQLINFTVQEADSVTAYEKTLQAFTEWKKDISAFQLAQLGFVTEEKSREALKNLVVKLYTPWLKFFNSSDASINFTKAYCPVLALNGSEDIQVLADLNLEGIKKALEKSKSPSFEIHKLNGLNHLFQHCKICSLAEYGQLEETFAPEALELMNNWLKLTIK
ncbi:MAG: alpha/beta hydrolase [Chitinophagaceae bacterium]